MLMTPGMIEKARAEFRELGAEGVRDELMRRRWPEEKIRLAREWLEHEDARQWQGRKGAAPLKPRSDWKVKWAGYMAIGLGFVLAVTMLSGMFHH